MPNLVLVGVGLHDARRNAVRDLVPGKVRETDIDTAAGPARVFVVGDGAVHAETRERGTRDGGVGVAFGAGRGHDAALSGGHGDLLDGADGDLLAVVADADGVTIAAGGGHHRWTTTTFPEGGTLAGSNVGAVARVRGADLELDRSYEDFALAYGFHPDGRTPFAAVRQLAPGRHRLGDGPLPGSTPDPLRPAEPTAGPAAGEAARPPVRDLDAAADRLGTLLLEILEEQAEGSRHHAVLLGGFDSALVTSGLRHLGHDVDTYTFSFGDPQYEQANAASFAARVGATHHEVRIEPHDVMDHLRHFADTFPGIGAQPHYQIHTLLACEQLAADGFDHVFSGDGCDAVFLGYPTVSARARLGARLSVVPTPVASAVRRLLGGDTVAARIGHPARVARGMLGNLALDGPAAGHLPTAYLDEFERARLRRGPVPPQAEAIADIRRRLAAPVADLDPIRLAFHGNGLNRQSQAKVDGSVLATGVRQSSPYRDPRLTDFVSALPVEFLRPPGTAPRDAGKAVLIEAVRRLDLLPADVIDLPKQSPSDSPIDRWYAGLLRNDVLDLLGHLPFEVDREAVAWLLRPKRAEEWYRDRVSISHHALQAVGILCSYASFCRLVPS